MDCVTFVASIDRIGMKVSVSRCSGLSRPWGCQMKVLGLTGLRRFLSNSPNSYQRFSRLGAARWSGSYTTQLDHVVQAL